MLKWVDCMGYELHLIKLFKKIVPPNIQIKLEFWKDE